MDKLAGARGAVGGVGMSMCRGLSCSLARGSLAEGRLGKGRLVLKSAKELRPVGFCAKGSTLRNSEKMGRMKSSVSSEPAALGLMGAGIFKPAPSLGSAVTGAVVVVPLVLPLTFVS